VESHGNGANGVNPGDGGDGGTGNGDNGTKTPNAGNGANGVVILSVPTAVYSGPGAVTGSPTVTTSGANTIIKFTGNGTYTQ
jgi:hypothetical protein